MENAKSTIAQLAEVSKKFPGKIIFCPPKKHGTEPVPHVTIFF